MGQVVFVLVTMAAMLIVVDVALPVKAQAEYHKELTAPIRFVRWVWWHHQVEFLGIVIALVVVAYFLGRFSR